MSVLKKILGDLKPYKKRIYLIIGLSVILAVLSLVGPYVYKILTDTVVGIIDGGVELSESWGGIVWVLAIWAVAEILFYIFDAWFQRNVVRIENWYSCDLTLKAFAYVQNLSLRFHVQQKAGSVMKKIDRAADFAWQVISALLSQILLPAIMFVAITIVLFWQNWLLAIVAVGTIPIYVWITYVITTKISSQQEMVTKRWEKSYGSAYDAMTNIEAVKAFGAEDYEQKKVGGQFTEAYRRQIKIVFLWVKSGFWRNILFMSSQIAVFALGIYLAAIGEITVGTIVLFISFLQKLHAPLYQLTETYTRLQQGMTTIGRVYKLMGKQTEVKDMPNAKKILEVKGDVKLDNVSFGYDSKRPTLKNLNIHAKPGEIVALVGPSGVGKSTLANLITRFYDPTGGKVLIDGVDIKSVQQQSLRKQIGIVTQENILFNDTILNNVAYGNGGENSEKIEEAVEVANLTEVIRKLPNRYQTLVGERGVRLSGGEKQRVSIARAVLKNPPILILDEATSHLDSVSEKLVQDALWKLIKGRTTFIIAHRLSTIRKADKIIVLKDGKIVEQGKHEELVKKGGIYNNLHELQVR